MTNRWINKTNVEMTVSVIFFVLGWWALLRFGEESVYTIVAFLVTIVVGGYALFIKGLKNLSRFRFDLNTLMTVAIIGAAAIGEWWEGAAVVLLFAVSEWLEDYSMERARKSIRALADIAPKAADVKKGGQTVRIAVEDIRPGDVVIVKPGQKIAVDGLVTAGLSSVSEAAITGESIPVHKQAGSVVYAGTLNGEGQLEIEVTRTAQDSTLAKVIELVEEAQSERAPAQKFVDRFAHYYTPLIIGIALVISIIPPLLGGVWLEWIYRGLAVLVVGCPCALIISTPVAIVTAIGNAAHNGVLIKGGVHLEQAGKLSAIAFDKTGTLTRGSPRVTDVLPTGAESAESVIRIAAAIEQGMGHPLATAIVHKAQQYGVTLPPAKEVRAVTGMGAEAVIAGTKYRIGRPDWFAAVQLDTIEQLREQGKTVMVLGTEEEVLAIMAAEDEIRAGVRPLLKQLRALGIHKTVMLTGDNAHTARTIAAKAGIEQVEAGLLPADKLEYIRRLKEEQGQVAMVGDGVNDAPALAAADIGIAMGGASTDTALETADVALMSDDLSKLPYLLQLSRSTLGIIRQNITIALGLKAAALLLIIPGWLSLWMAIFADMGATLIVTLNAMRLLRIRPQKNAEAD